MKNKIAYTLAEALLTMTIIGVIGMVSVPVLKSFTDTKQYVAGAKKAYKTLDSATSSLEMRDVKISASTTITDLISYYHDVLYGVDTGKETYNVQKFNGGLLKNFSPDNYVLSSDGMAWYFEKKTAYLQIYVDVNGPTGPNKIYVDVHNFTLNYSNSEIKANNCTKYAIQNEKMPWVEDKSKINVCG